MEVKMNINDIDIYPDKINLNDLHYIECGDGWKDLIIDLFSEIAPQISTKKESIKILQIKEKYGQLRVYFSSDKYNENINNIIYKYENLSKKICELCGDKSTIVTSGWIKNLCNSCYTNSK